MTIFDILKTDHKKVGLILKQIEKTNSTHSDKREALFSKLQEEFSLHAKSEEKAVYTPLKTKDKTHKMAMEAYEEHGLVEHLFNQLSGMSPADDTWTAKVAVLTELIKHHVEEEETILFRKMKTLCDSSELTQMARDFKNIKKEKAEYSLGKKMKMNQEELRA